MNTDSISVVNFAAARVSRVAVVLLLLLSTAAFVGCTPSRSQFDRLRAENVELRNENERLKGIAGTLENDRDILSAEIQRLQQELASKPEPAPVSASSNSGFGNIPGVETFESRGAITVRVPGDVLFSSGKVTLKSTAKSTLQQVASVIKREYGGNTVRVEGYTDSDPIKKSKWKDNLELSLQRAAAVHRYLAGQGISSDQMYAAGFGQSKPQGSKALSRRVEIVVELQ